MSEPIAWVYPEFMKNIKDAKCWTAYATYHKDRPIPLYTHPPTKQSSLAEPVAYRYDFDGYGYQYIDSGSGSDWEKRIKDAEPLYTHPATEQSSLSDEEIMDCWENEVNKWQEIENYDIYNFARAIIKSSRGEK
jgi:hypothetical protein